ncbi:MULTISPECIES: hypothetical protein [unclassified Vibrio]|uniref:Uncharacterized protein n=1 Tax=Vibrio sp. HB236076 TaxID=3232307 RepID=A0AB39H6T1_9VIBR|nr:hypothetical protein [Vibrio sp. HB161653]MDP5253559.1 hypothetical protein [Vibrio sp. HB161653]
MTINSSSSRHHQTSHAVQCDIDHALELQHIWLEIQAQRWHQIERFLWPLFCYRHGYVTNKGKPCLTSAKARLRRSDNALKSDSVTMIALVPFKAIIGELKKHEKDGNLSFSRMQRVLLHLLDYRLISAAEWQTLISLGLQHQMPALWYQQKNVNLEIRMALADITFHQSH